MAQLLRRVAARHDVALLYLREQSEGQVDPDIAALCERVEAVERPRLQQAGLLVRLSRRARSLVSLVRGVPLWVQAVDVSAFAAAAERAVRDWRPDLVQLEYHVMGRYLNAVSHGDVPKVLVFYETGTDAAGRAHDNASWLLLRLDRRAWRVYERRVLRRVRAAVVLTDADRQRLADRGVDVVIETIALGVEIPPEAADPLGSSPPSVLFVGNYRHDPNRDAALRLVHDVWPTVRNRRPDAVLLLVGESLPEALAAAAGRDVEIHGSVPAIEPYLARAAVSVAPLREGGGMRVKVLEAMAAGKAVVASPLAVEGLAVADGRELLVASSDGQFADAIVRILGDTGLQLRLASAAREWALENAGPDRTAAAFESLYRRLTGDRS